MEIGGLETRSRKKMEALRSKKRKVVAKRPNGEDISKGKMNDQLSKTEDGEKFYTQNSLGPTTGARIVAYNLPVMHTLYNNFKEGRPTKPFEKSSLAYGGFWGNEPGKRVPMGSTDPFFGNPVKDVYLSHKYKTVPLAQEDHGKTGKTVNKTDGSKIEKREDKLHMEKGQNVLENMTHLHGMKPKKMEKGLPDTNPSENALEMAEDLRKKKMKKTQRSDATDMHSVKISVLQANMTEICGKKPKNQHKKTEKGKLVTSPSKNAFEMPAVPGEERSEKNYLSLPDNIETMKLSDVQPNMMDPCSKKQKIWLKTTEKGKPVTNPSEYVAEMPANLEEKIPKGTLSATVQITSDLQANRIDQCAQNPEDHKKTEKEELVTSPIENVEMLFDIGKDGALFSDPKGHAERETSGLNWASSSVPHGIIQSTNTATIGQAWQASAIKPLKRRHNDQDIFDSPKFKKRKVCDIVDLVEQFEELSI